MSGAGLDRLAEDCDIRPMVKESTRKSPTTLGDVLYARCKAPVPEQEWVTLVQSIAAGDQLALHALYERTHRIVFTLIMRITANRETSEELTLPPGGGDVSRVPSFRSTSTSQVAFAVTVVKPRLNDTHGRASSSVANFCSR
jgi:hypothetical protein